MTDREELLAAWRAEETGPGEGWDFSALEGRYREDLDPWDLETQDRLALARARHVLDMGTGGGEYLRRLGPALPADTVATEGWEPNISVARDTLTPWGIQVVPWAHHEHDPSRPRMPFPDGRFDLVLNRHEAYDPAEVYRVLEPGGLFLTQQVGGDEVAELHAATGKRPEHPLVNYRRFRAAAEESGLKILDGAEHVGSYEFADVAALVAYLQLVPWDVPSDFAVDRYADALIRLHESGPAHGGPVLLTRKRFWLKAIKPA